MQQALFIRKARTDQPCILEAQIEAHREGGTGFGGELPQGFEQRFSMRAFGRSGGRGNMDVLYIRGDPMGIIERCGGGRIEQIKGQEMTVKIGDLADLMFLIRESLEVVFKRRMMGFLGVEVAVGDGKSLRVGKIAFGVSSEVVEVACEGLFSAKRSADAVEFVCASERSKQAQFCSGEAFDG